MGAPLMLRITKTVPVRERVKGPARRTEQARVSREQGWGVEGCRDCVAKMARKTFPVIGLHGSHRKHFGGGRVWGARGGRGSLPPVPATIKLNQSPAVQAVARCRFGPIVQCL